MLKQTGPLRYTGLDKSTGKVHVDRGDKIIVRERPKKGSHEGNAVFKENSDAAAGVSLIAGNVNTIFKLYAPAHTEPRTYARLLRHIWKAKHPHRFVKLTELAGIDAHRRNPLDAVMSGLELSVHPARNKISVKLETKRHPKYEKDHRFYRMQVILVLWNNANDNFAHEEMRTEWIHKSEEPGGYDMEFERPAGSTDYLVLCCCIRGEEKAELRLPPDRTLKIMLAGSLDKKSLKVLEEHRAALEAKIKPNMFDKGVEVAGVKARKKKV